MFDALLWDCFEGPNRCEADGLSAHIGQTPRGCVVLAFRIDSDAFRREVGLGAPGARCCDRLLLVLQRPLSGNPKLFFYLLEMKGRGQADAVEQLESTLQALQRHLGARREDGHAQFYAIIVSDRAPPRSLAIDQARFARDYGARLLTISAQRNIKRNIEEKRDAERARDDALRSDDKNHWGGADLTELLPPQLRKATKR